MRKILIPPFFWYLGFVAFFFIACSSDENPKSPEHSNKVATDTCPKGFYQAKPTDSTCSPVSGAYVSPAGSVVQFKCKGDTIPKPDKGSCTTCGIGTHTKDNIRCISSTRSCKKDALHGQQTWSNGKGWGDCRALPICTPANAPANSGVRVNGVCERRGNCKPGFYKDGSYCSRPGNGTYADANSNFRPCAHISHATLGPGTTTAASCSFTCNRGYTKQGRQCIAQTCTPADAPAHSGLRVDGVCERKNCNAGFYKDGRYCSRPGNGKYATASGILRSCTLIAHATLGPGTTTAQSCSFTCNSGYTKISNTGDKGRRACFKNGEKCTPRSAPAHSGVVVKGVCERRGNCNPGFYKDGSYCSRPGNGTYADANSNLRPCAHISHATLGPGTPGTTTAQSCSFTCNSGYTKQGRQCVENAQNRSKRSSRGVENAQTQQAQNQICPVTRDQVRHQPFFRSRFDTKGGSEWFEDRIVVDYNFSLCFAQNRTKIKQGLEYAIQTWNSVSTSRIYFQLGSEFELSVRMRTGLDLEKYPKSQKVFVFCENDEDNLSSGWEHTIAGVSNWMIGSVKNKRWSYAVVHINAINGNSASLRNQAIRYSNAYKNVLLRGLGRVINLGHVDNKYPSIMNANITNRITLSPLDIKSITHLYPTVECERTTRKRRSLATFPSASTSQDQAMENQKEDEINEMKLHSQPLPSSDHDPHAEDSSHSFSGGVKTIE